MTVLTVVQIVLAWAGYGVWSLVYGTIAAFSVRSLALWWLAPIRVGRFDLRVFQEMFHFGKHMTLSTLGLWLIKNMDYYFVGRYLGLAALGYYTLAFKLSDLIAVNVVRNLASVLFPAYSELKQDVERLRGAWLRSVRYTMLLVMPMGLGLMLFSREIILAFYPGKDVVIVPMAILVVFSLCRGVGVPLGDLAKAIGRPQILTRAVIVHILLMAPALYVVTAWLGLELDQGLVAVSVVVAAVPIIAVHVSYRLAARHVKFTAKQVLGALLPSVVAGAVMAAGTLAVKWGLLWLAPGMPALVILVALGALSCLLYALALLKLFPETARDLRGLLERGKKGKVGAAPAVAAPR
jgi:O-antigen/teichoic acid export membrane protein